MARAFLIVSALFAGAAAFTPTPPGQSLRSLGGFKQVQREQSTPARLARGFLGRRRTVTAVEAPAGPPSVSLRTPLPKHEGQVTGVLPNGIRYVLLQNAAPRGRFEAHLEVLSGSADELEEQQGMAHIVEHIAYMGSTKRERLFGTGSQTNAYTDFHHTVFYASCPVRVPGSMSQSSSDMLNRALEALAEVLCAQFQPKRLEKERAAVLSEMNMVNTIEYRVECAILEALHAENALSSRFPIGLRPLIETWTIDDVKRYHDTHYSPGNAVVYIVGDIPTSQMLSQLQDVMGSIPATKEPMKIKAPGLFNNAMPSFTFPGSAPAKEPTPDPPTPAGDPDKEPSLKLQSRHFPPILHGWSGGNFDGTAKIPLELVNPLQSDMKLDGDAEARIEAAAKACEVRLDNLATKGGVVRIFEHEMLSSVSFHLFAKRPIVPMTTLESYKDALARRIALAALQVRLNVLSRSEPLFSYVEFNMLDSAREACAVCSLDMMCDPNRWDVALTTALNELRALVEYGITEEEMERYMQALMADSDQLAAQGDMIANSDQLSQIMESVACGHTFMSAEQTHAVTCHVLSLMTLEEVNAAAAELGEHVMKWGSEDGTRPSAFIGCAPTSLGFNENTLLSFMDTLSASPVPEPDLSQLQVPPTLLRPEQLPPGFDHVLSADEVSDCFDTATEDATAGLGASEGDEVTMRRLKSGVMLNYRPSADEPQRAFLRLTVPGGRAAEAKMEGDDAAPPLGSIALGARTLQEGGALGGLSRTQVELFCIDQLVMVEIITDDEFVHFNFAFPTNKVAGEASVSGTEAVFQIVRQILAEPHPADPDGFVWEEDALERALVGLSQQQDQDSSSLEGAAANAMVQQMVRQDPRFVALKGPALQAITIETAAAAFKPFLRPEYAEVSVSGDIARQELEELAARYFGSLPEAPVRSAADWVKLDLGAKAAALAAASPEEAQATVDAGAPADRLSCPFLPPTVLDSGDFIQNLNVRISDSDPRAIAHVGGTAPNRWGLLRDGTDIRDLFGIPKYSPEEAERLKEGRTLLEVGKELRRAQPLWPAATLALVQEVLNRRLFSVVREKRQLTYDANFQLTAFERLNGGWWLVTVTASPNKAQEALEACVTTLMDVNPAEGSRRDGVASLPLIAENLRAAQRVLTNKHTSELRTNKYWTEIMTGTQLPDWIETVNAVTLEDLNLMLQVLDLKREDMYTCVAISGDENAATAPASDAHGHTAPSLLRR